MDSFAWFKAIVSERRNLNGDALDKVADGRAFTGRQALELGLIDQIGGDAEARAWLQQTKGISTSLPVRDWEPSGGTLSELGFARSAIAGLADVLGFPVIAQQLRGSVDLHALDGLVAIWHPSLYR
jgi:protease-4